MQIENIERFLIEAFTNEITRRDQEFVPLLSIGSPQAKTDEQRPEVHETDPRQVFEEAYAEGEKAGFEMGMKKVEPLVERLNAYLTELEAYERDLLQKAESLATGLALTFAESIVLKQCNEHREALIGMIRKALELCDQKGKKTIRIRPEDSKFIEQQSAGWTVYPDETLREPGFVIETDFGDVDGRISTQMEELKKEFLGAAEGACSFSAEGDQR
jgi:flagellar assembly protein FliH